MFFLVYVSSAVHPFSPQDLIELLEVSRRNNQALEITGLLLYKDGGFMQFLEGAEENVLSVMEKVKNDPRHHRVLTLIQGEHEHREFGGWSMGFKKLGDDAISEFPGYSNFLDMPLTSEEFLSNPSQSLTLLTTFKNVMR